MIDNANLKTKLVGDVVVARIKCSKIGDFEAPVLRAELEQVAVEHGGRLVVDMTEVLILGSSGIGAMLTLKRVCEAAEGRLVLCGLSDELMGMLKIASLLKMFTIKKDADAALGVKR